MNAEHHVTSLEESRLLKDAGYPQDGTLFVWVRWSNTSEYVLLYCPDRKILRPDNTIDWLAAPIATEVGLKRCWICTHPAEVSNIVRDDGDASIQADTEANARSMMWRLHPETREFQ